jgi:hypothetical protein
MPFIPCKTNTMRNFLTTLILACTLSVQAQSVLKLKLELVETTPTEKVYNFITENFVGFIGWQFLLEFDGTKMKYKEIRNPIHPTQTSSNFNEPTPGQLRSVWLDYDLVPNDYPDSTVLFQLVFELLDPEGAPVCFQPSQDFFEFIVHDGPGSFFLSEIVISDDCYQGFSIFLEGTATENPSTPVVDSIKDVYLSSTGTLSFTSNLDQTLRLSLFDMNGKVLTSFDKKEYGVGRHTLKCKNVSPGMYLFKVTSGDGKDTAIKVLAY